MGANSPPTVSLHGVLVDLDVVLPGTDNGKVGTRHGAHAAVGATVELELELVGEGGTVQFVLIVHGQLVAHVLRVVAGIFTARLAKAGFRRTQVGAGTTQVDVHLVGQFVEDFFQLGVWVPSSTMSPVEPCMLVRPEPRRSQISHRSRRNLLW